MKNYNKVKGNRMKKKSLLIFLVVILFLPFIQTPAQDLQFILSDSVMYGELGIADITIPIYVINISPVDQTLFLVNTEEQLPNSWSYELCLDLCYPPGYDSITTSQPLHSLDTLEASVHFLPNLDTAGTGYLQVQFGTMHNPTARTTFNLTASTEPTAVGDPVNSSVKEFKLNQNYPNPFNPTTTISYAIPRRSDVSLKVYNIVGQEVATLVNGEKEPGTYSVYFNGSELSSGIYFYKITAGSFSTVRKMILLK